MTRRLTALLLVLVATASCSRSDDPRRVPAAIKPRVVAPTTTTVALPPPPPPLPVAAHAIVGRVATYETAGGPPAAAVLANPTWEAQPLVMLVKERQGGFLRVQIPARPNESTVWVKDTDVELKTMATTVTIERGAHRLRVFDTAGAQLLEEPVAIGRPTTPTPVGAFYVDAIVENPGRPYGAWQLSVAGFSDVLMRFAGGNGQIAIHGWHDPSVVGKSVSNGCIRMSNESVTRVAQLVGLGTPVTIVD